MQRTEVQLVCDVCGKEESPTKVVRQRSLKVNRREVVVEVCDKDWPDKSLEKLLRAGRKPGTPSRRL